MSTIGLEVHCQLTGLNSKLFCRCRADYRGLEPNSNICPVCMGMPGTLPRLNRAAVEGAITVSLSLGCTVPPKLAFFRKNYFYPDLPKNFQITQLDAYGPTSAGASGGIEVGGQRIRIRRVQLEEDPGRLTYEGSSERTQVALVDYNRAGVPLVEIVTEPDFDDPARVRLFLKLLSELLGNLGICNPALEGAVRCDGNISVDGGAKVELKNVGSFHDLEKALHFETARQEALVSKGIPVVGETRQWDERRRVTVSARLKEDEPDYRYLLEHDIPWVAADRQTLARLHSSMPESLDAKKERYTSLGISSQVADVLSAERIYSDLFEQAHTVKNARVLANIITTDLMGMAGPLPESAHLSELADMILAEKITRASAKDILHQMIKNGKPPGGIVDEAGLGGPTDESELEEIVEQIISEQSQAAESARANPQAVNYLVGMVMKKTRGRADPALTVKLIRRLLGMS